MKRPAPDALLIAQHVHEWPAAVNNGLYLYRMPSGGRYREKMFGNGYNSPGGIAYTGVGTTVVTTMSKTDMVRLHLVFVPDDDVADVAQPFLGRDVEEKEWEEAREWLTQQEIKHGS